MSIPILEADTLGDTELVAQSLAGGRDAFGRIVRRYQSLVCAVAFSATGDVSRSEDLAQETFVTAWRELPGLRDPAKLRPWLCGIARNLVNSDRRRLGREPAHGAGSLADARDVVAPEPLPSDVAVTREEVAVLWREVGRLPEIYREPLVLYYREHQSVTRVATALELSEDVVMQRLSRGRKQLHERMLAFVEATLVRTNPGQGFVRGVQAALPLMGTGGQGPGVAVIKGGTLKGSGWLGLAALALPFVGMFAALGLSWSSIQQAPDPIERRFAWTWNLLLWGSIGALILGFSGVEAVAAHRHWVFGSLLEAYVGVWFAYLLMLATLLVVFHRRTAAGLRRQQAAGVVLVPSKNARAGLVATYVATTGWIIGFAWMMGDGGTAALLALLTTALAIWHHRELRGRDAVAAHRVSCTCHVALCCVLVLVANLQVDLWLASFYHMKVDEMRRLLPMEGIHLLTVLLAGWVGLLVWLTREKREGRDQNAAD